MDEGVRAVGRGVIKVLVLVRVFIDGAEIGSLQQDCRIETIAPVRATMNLHADALGLARLRDFHWEPSLRPDRSRPRPLRLPHRVAKREAQRQQTLHEREAKRAAETRKRPAAVPTTNPRPCWAWAVGCQLDQVPGAADGGGESRAR